MKPGSIVLAALLFATGCGLYSVVATDKDDTADFSSYKTYAWLPDKDNSNNTLNNRITRNNIKNYFSHELADHYGLTANTEDPDVLLEFTVTFVDRVKTEEHPVTTTIPNPTPNYTYSYPYNSNPYPPNPSSQNPYYSPQPNPYNYNGYNNGNFGYSGNASPGYRYQTTYVKEEHDYTQSSIVINMIDRKRNELVWTATAQGDIYDESQKYVKDQLHPAVHRIMRSFPIERMRNPNGGK